MIDYTQIGQLCVRVSPYGGMLAAASDQLSRLAGALRSGGCLGDVCLDVLAHRVQLVGQWGERAEARVLAEGSAGLLQRIEPFFDDLPGRVLVRQHEDGGAD